MSKLPLKSMNGESLGDFDISDELLVHDKGLQSMKDAVVAYRAGQRSGSASTLTKAEVNGTGAKPWKQKGLGRARAGYRQSPIWRGGGVAFGPKPRSYAKKLSKKASRLAFRRAFSEKIAAGQVTVIDEITISEPKTKLFVDIVSRLDVRSGALFVIDNVEPNVLLASRNLARVEVVTASEVNTYQLLRYPAVFVTKTAMEALEKRLSPTVRRGE